MRVEVTLVPNTGKYLRLAQCSKKKNLKARRYQKKKPD
jgi:hypothetical protein